MGKKSTNYNDDDPVPAPSGKIVENIFKRADSPLEKTDFRLVVELMGFDTGDQRGGVDIVAVLDVSGSMGGKKLQKLKSSMKFLLKKLDPIDRLSIVTFSSDATRLCPLTGMTKNGQAKIEKLINELDARGGTNISSGLQTALSVLAQRRHSDGRTTAIMLMSDGQDRPSTVDVSSVAVYTFGLGNDHDSQLLQEIASKSDKGTYSIADVEGSNSASLNKHFHHVLRGSLVWLYKTWS
ncbi:E3 ubiquitin-protein ligase WAVH1-like isoform X2 [Silene latifolia]|uniref:E3 ubiquitin-protein ligase WAVH1-like isoform X2 n=1 Tax=Silene latifolia TaxID=37657 RepID=UPI003D76EAF0